MLVCRVENEPEKTECNRVFLLCGNGLNLWKHQTLEESLPEADSGCTDGLGSSAIVLLLRVGAPGNVVNMDFIKPEHQALWYRLSC